MSEHADRLRVALADRYRIERELGQGGMATVYLAFDEKHDRKVAIKVLKPELAAVLGAERFVVEIKTTAAMSHPHILPLFDSGTADGFLFYVMPYIQGETIREKLNRETQFGVDEAVRIAREVADALDYAHRHGVIHRDIKPENILLHDGRAMVMDFGIALPVSAAAGGRMTETGLSLGTPHYMSPEQATAEKDITGRSDQYSLASVLYEMLAGQPPHVGGAAQQVIMRIIADTARPVGEIRRNVPPNVADALGKALEKLPADRFESVKAFSDALGNPVFTSLTAGTTSGVSRPWQVNRLSMALAAALAVVAALAVWPPWRTSPAKHVARFNVPLPLGRETTSGPWSRIALTPDGSRFIYSLAVPTGRQLWVRDRDQLDGRVIPGTDGAVSPFVAPEGDRVGYFRGNAMFVVSLQGGPPVPLTDTLVGQAGGSWGTDGFIYADGAGFAPLVRVSATGADKPEVFTTLDSARGETNHQYPEALPNGKGILFIAFHGTSPETRMIAVANTATGAHAVLLPGVYARYAKSGHLVYVTSDGTLMAVPFDQDAMETTGAAVALASGIPLRGPVGNTPELALADDGTLMYTVGGSREGEGEPVWVGRDGRAEVVAPDWTQRALDVALSADGTQLAVAVQDDRGSQLWVRRLSPGGTASQLTFSGSSNSRPAWTPDGRSALFVSTQGGDRDLYSRRADGTAKDSLVLDLNEEVWEGHVTGDGKWLVYRTGAGSAADLYARRTSGDTTPIALASSAFTEASPAVSPNVRWLAYVSNESGQSEVYVRPFPDVAGGKWAVSVGGGTDLLWARDGRELFYRNGSGELVAVAVSSGDAAPPTGRQRVLFSARPYVMRGQHPTYDVSPDGRRFVMLRPAGTEATRQTQLIVVQNFFEELKRLVPRK